MMGEVRTHNWVFYSHVICSGTKIQNYPSRQLDGFYSHVICSGTKIQPPKHPQDICFTVT